jgi:4'-phosphopantetheinyl transferase
LVALADVGRIGVDIEALQHDPEDAVLELCLSPAERGYVAGIEPRKRRSAFYRCWVRKEAVVKAAGIGIVTDLTALEVHPEAEGVVLSSLSGGQGPDLWSVSDLHLGPSFAAAAAWPAGRAMSVVMPRDRNHWES